MRSARIVGWRLWLAVACLAPAAHATTVLVMSIEQGRAQLLVNGTAVRTLREGQTSPEGVKLISADRTRAVLEVDGRELALGLGGSTVASAEVKADRWGMYARRHSHGVATPAVIDTGAFAVSITREEAERMSIRYATAPRIEVTTAGGQRSARRVNFATVRVGGITLHNVDGVVVENQKGDSTVTLIGATSLNSVEMRRIGDTLTLTRRKLLAPESEALGQHHRLAVALHLGAVEEAHAEERRLQPAFEHHAVDAVQRDVAEPDGVELHAVGRRGAVRRLHQPPLALEVVDPETLCLGSGQGDRRRAGVDQEPHRAAVHLAIGDEVAAGIGLERDRAGAAARGSGGDVGLVHLQRPALAVDLLEGRGLAVHGDEHHALGRALPHRRASAGSRR